MHFFIEQRDRYERRGGGSGIRSEWQWQFEKELMEGLRSCTTIEGFIEKVVELGFLKEFRNGMRVRISMRLW